MKRKSQGKYNYLSFVEYNTKNKCTQCVSERVSEAVLCVAVSQRG